MSGEPHPAMHGLNEQQCRLLVDMLDAKAHAPAGPDKRRDPRYSYLVSGGLLIDVRHPGRSWGRYLVRSRNISRQGIGFFHSGFLHPTTYCRLTLPKRDGGALTCDGHVAHCRFVFGSIHEVGVMFDQAINVRPFIETADDASHGVARDHARRFSGRLLVVHDGEEQRSLLKFQAQQMGVEVVEAEDAPEAIDYVRSGPFDLIIAGVDLPSMSVDELMLSLDAEGCKTPVIPWGPQMANAAPHAGLPTPFTPDNVVAVLEHHLSSAEGGGEAEAAVIRSSLWADAALRPRVLAYLEKLEEQTLKLEAVLEAEDLPSLQNLAQEMQEPASQWGYRSIADTCAALAASPTENLAPAIATATRLLADCQAACRFRATLQHAEVAGST